MKLFGKNLARDVVIVAEIGVNHEGDLEAALRLLRLAAESGCDAVKFQSYTPDRYVSAADPERLARVARFALDEAAHRRLAEEAQRHGVAFFSTAVSEDWVPFLAGLCPAIKIASGDLTHEAVIRAVAATGKPMILSTGLGTVEEIDRAVAIVRSEIGAAPLAERLVLMHCVSAYPTPIEEANVRSVPYLASRYGVPVGYSNHVVGIEACLAAIAVGATVVEVHVTDCKSGREFRDHALSLEPDELAALVRAAPRIRASLGHLAKNRQPSEIPNLTAIRKGVVARRDLAPGTVLARDDLMFARPADEIPAAEIDSVLGRRLTVACRRGEPIRRDAIA